MCCVYYLYLNYKGFYVLLCWGGFSRCLRYVPLLLVSAVFSSISSFYGSLYGALKKTVNNMLSTLSSAVINITINYVLIPLVGLWGAVIGTVAAYFFVAMYRMFDVRRYVYIEIDWTNYIINCFIVFIQAILVSMNLYVYAVSFMASIAFLINNFKYFKKIKFKNSGLSAN